MLIEQVQEILATLSLAFENLLESSSPVAASITTITRPQSPSFEASPSRAHRPARVKKFQRPSRRMMMQSKTPSPSTSPVPFAFNEASSRKRSWDSEAGDVVDFEGEDEQFSVEAEHSGKRSKSVVLLQELESLRVSSPPSPIDSELAVLAEQEFSANDFQNSILSLSNVRAFDEVLAELEALQCIEDVFEALMTVSSAVLSQNRSQLTSWCKWRLLSKTFESFDGLPIRFCLNRFIFLCRAVNHIADELDWRDPELSFLLFKGATQLLTKQTSGELKVTLLMRKLDEFVGLTRALALVCTILWNRPPRSVLQFLASNAEPQLNEFFEQLLEAALNLFEICSVLTASLGQCRTFALIFVHFGRLFVPAGAEISSFYERLRKCKLSE